MTFTMVGDRLLSQNKRRRGEAGSRIDETCGKMEEKWVTNGDEFRGLAVIKVYNFLIKVSWRGSGSPGPRS